MFSIPLVASVMFLLRNELGSPVPFPAILTSLDPLSPLCWSSLPPGRIPFSLSCLSLTYDPLDSRSSQPNYRRLLEGLASRSAVAQFLELGSTTLGFSSPRLSGTGEATCRRWRLKSLWVSQPCFFPG